MNLGLVCLRKDKGLKKGFTGIKAFNKAVETNTHLEKLIKISKNNIKTTYENIQYCLENGIKNYRVSSEIIPFGELWNWKEHLKDHITKVGNINLTIHPSQFYNLTSKNQNVINNSINYLKFQNEICELFGIKTIILHVGGVFGDKKATLERFVENFRLLPKSIKEKLTIENCHNYSIDEIIELNKACGVNVCYDIHHQRVFEKVERGSNFHSNVIKILNELNTNKTIVHVSSGKSDRFNKIHADYIDVKDMYLIKLLSKEHFFYCEVEAKFKEIAIMEFFK